MSKHKFTPGPWKKRVFHWYGSNGEKVLISDGPGFGSKSKFPSAEANARLIAAAPDLLEALIQCRSALITAHPEIKDPLGRQVIERKIILASDVIAKALGDQ